MKRLLPYTLKAAAVSAAAMLAACGGDSGSGTNDGSASALTCADVSVTAPAWLYSQNGINLIIYTTNEVYNVDGTAYGVLDGNNIVSYTGTVLTGFDLNSLPVCGAGLATVSSSSVAPVSQATVYSSSAMAPVSSAVIVSSSSVVTNPEVSAHSSSAVVSSSSVISYSSPVALASTKDASAPASLYNLWKSYHYVTLEDEGVYYADMKGEFSTVFSAAFQPAARVIWSTQASSSYKFQCQDTESSVSTMKYRACTVSEGIGYGLLLTLFNNDNDAFNRLWNYSRAMRDYQGVSLTPWITMSFMYNSIDNSSATDADLDIATALILKYYQTNTQAYLTDALTIANAIWEKEVNKSTFMLYSGDTETWTTNPVYNLSYFSPVALRLFAMVDSNHDWNSVLDAMYSYMAKVQAAGTGVFPDWSDADGVAVNPPNNAAGNASTGYTYYTFNKESVRIPWRIAWDYYWNQDERDLTILKTLNDFIVAKSSGDPSSSALAIQYSWDASQADYTKNTSTPAQWMGAWCATGLGTNSEWLDKCTTALNALTVSNNGSSYFSDILLTMYSGLLNGNFVKPY